jgi:hypothetical protein
VRDRGGYGIGYGMYRAVSKKVLVVSAARQGGRNPRKGVFVIPIVSVPQIILCFSVPTLNVGTNLHYVRATSLFVSILIPTL